MLQKIGELLTEIRTIEGAMGSCVQVRRRLVYNDLPSIFKDEKILLFHNHVRYIQSAISILNFESKMHWFTFESIKILSILIDNSIRLSIVCDNSANESIIEMSFRVISKQLTALIDRYGKNSNELINPQTAGITRTITVHPQASSGLMPLNQTPLSIRTELPQKSEDKFPVKTKHSLTRKQRIEFKRLLTSFIGDEARTVWKEGYKDWIESDMMLSDLIENLSRRLLTYSEKEIFLRKAEKILELK